MDLQWLEQEMARLRALRAWRIQQAHDAIQQANEEYDREVLPLARLHTALRQQQQPARQQPAKQRATPERVLTHDPAWSQEDIDHFYELAKK